MKTMFLKLGILLALCTYASVSEAQTEKGMVRIGGEGSFYNSNYFQQDSLYYSKQKSSNFNFAPSAGIFVSDKICVGVSLPLRYEQRSGHTDLSGFTYPNTKSHTLRYEISPYMRYYINFSEKFYGHVNVGAGVYLTNTEEVSSNSTSEITRRQSGYGFSSGLNFGLTYFVTPKVALETTLVGVNYYNTHTTREGKTYENYTNNSGVSVNYFPSGVALGLSFFIK